MCAHLKLRPYLPRAKKLVVHRVSCTMYQNQCIKSSDNREVLLHVKRERVRVTSDSEAQLHVTFAYTFRFCYTSRRERWQTRASISKWHDNSPLNTFANKSERTLPNDILAQGRLDYRLRLAVIFSSVFAFMSHWDVHVMTLGELTGYTWKSRRVTSSLPWTMLQRTQVLMTSHPLVLFYTYTFTFNV